MSVGRRGSSLVDRSAAGRSDTFRSARVGVTHQRGAVGGVGTAPCAESQFHLTSSRNSASHRPPSPPRIADRAPVFTQAWQDPRQPFSRRRTRLSALRHSKPPGPGQEEPFVSEPSAKMASQGRLASSRFAADLSRAADSALLLLGPLSVSRPSPFRGPAAPAGVQSHLMISPLAKPDPMAPTLGSPARGVA